MWESAFQVEGKGKVPALLPLPAVDDFVRWTVDAAFVIHYGIEFQHFNLNNCEPKINWF